MPLSDSKVYIKCHPTGREGTANVVYTTNAQNQITQVQNERKTDDSEDKNIWAPKNWHKNPIMLVIVGLMLAALIGVFGYFMWKQIARITENMRYERNDG